MQTKRMAAKTHKHEERRVSCYKFNTLLASRRRHSKITKGHRAENERERRGDSGRELADRREMFCASPRPMISYARYTRTRHAKKSRILNSRTASFYSFALSQSCDTHSLTQRKQAEIAAAVSWWFGPNELPASLHIAVQCYNIHSTQQHHSVVSKYLKAFESICSHLLL